MNRGSIQQRYCLAVEQWCEHLCYIRAQGFHLENARTYQALVENPQFQCRHCGRTAHYPGSLCAPAGAARTGAPRRDG
jgi:hypothetical protein